MNISDFSRVPNHVSHFLHPVFGSLGAMQKSSNWGSWPKYDTSEGTKRSHPVLRRRLGDYGWFVLDNDRGAYTYVQGEY